jgi:hypothetical protein
MQLFNTARRLVAGCAFLLLSQFPFAYGQSLSFLLTPSYADPTNQPIEAIAPVVADFNGDGKLDMATSLGNVLLGNGDGTFRMGTSFAPFPDVIAVDGFAEADVNGDGKPDLVMLWLMDSGTSKIAVFLGNGDGTFQAPIVTDPGVRLGGALVGDVNGDGKPDVVAFGSGSPSLFVFLGNGNGTFTALAPNASIPYFQLMADFNGDGKLDLAWVNDGSVYVYLGNGDGTFQAPVVSNVLPTDGSESLSAEGDFNGDGKLDVVVSISDIQISEVLLGNGDGTFQSPSPSIAAYGAAAVGDVNGDGKLDLVVNGTIGIDSQGCFDQVFLGNGDGTFTPGGSYSTASSASASPVLADFAGNGKLDAAVEGQAVSTVYNASPESVFVLVGNGDGTFQGMPQLTNPAAAVADFNGDGKPDVATLSYSPLAGQVVNILLNTGTLPPPVSNSYSLGAGVTAQNLVAADLRNNGKTDLVIPTSVGSTGTAQIETMLGNGDGTFAAPSVVATLSTGEQVPVLIVGDFNNDQKPDVAAILLNGGSTSVYILLGNGDGTFGAPTSYFVGQSPVALVAADFNGDGNLDLAVATTAGIAIMLGKGDGTFQSPTYIGSSYVSLITGDVNGDGKPDLVAYEQLDSDAPPLQVFLGNGDGTFQTLPTFGTGSNGGLALADFNGDGKPDLITNAAPVEGVPVRLAVYPGNGNGTFGSPIYFLASAGAPIFVSDFNGDGSLDVLAGSEFFVNTTPATPPPSPGFALAPASGSPTSQTIAAGKTAMFSLDVTPSGSFTGTVNLSCAITPVATPSPSCSLSSSTVQISGTGSQSFTVAVGTTAPVTTAIAPHPGFLPPPGPLICIFILLGATWLGVRKRKLALAVGTSALAFVLVFGVSCGGSGSTPKTSSGTPAGTYTATVTATSGSLSHNAALQVVVQ